MVNTNKPWLFGVTAFWVDGQSVIFNHQPINTMAININDHDHDRIIHLLDKLDHAIHRLDDQGYPVDHPSFCDAIARLDGARAIFDIINGNV